MRDQHRTDIPGLGTVTLGSVTMGTVTGAHSAAEQAEEANRADAFANFVLAGMFVEPQKTPEDIACFPADTLTAVIEIAVDRLRIAEHFMATQEDLPVRERFFTAYHKHEQEMFDDLNTAIQGNVRRFATAYQQGLDGPLRQVRDMASVSQQVAEQLSRFSVPTPVVDIGRLTVDTHLWTQALSISQNIAKLAQPILEAQDALMEQVREALRGLDDTMRHMSASLAAAALSAQQMISLGVFDNLRRLIQSHQDAVEAFKAAGWPIAPSMPSELIEHVVALHKQRQTRHISRAIIGYYQRDSHRCLREAVRSWESIPLFAPRMHILNDALKAHCSGLYTLSVPALIPQIEGVLNDYVLANRLAARLGKIQQVYEAAIGDADQYGLSEWVIACTLLHQLQTNTYVFTDFKAELKRSVKVRHVTRHTVLHGVALRYDRTIHSLRAFLLLDALSALQNP